jgi:purine-nucleoside/S-methyl-5'-thioadenosine phosphorylase / adenosine deaminase
MLERRVLPGRVTALVSKRLESDGFLVAFTERTGGASAAPYRSLNLGLRTDDVRERVTENRRRACSALGIQRFACGEQVHRSALARVGPKRAAAGFDDPESALPGADALWTTSRAVPLAVLVADCVPLALAEATSGVLAVVHAGWRGIASGVLRSALRRFDEPASVRAAIGPAIGSDHYEVGEDVALAVSAAAEGGAVIRRDRGRLFLDLPGTVARVLKELGVRSIERAEECTACERARFFSHRRDGETGRQALIATRI